MGCACIKTCSRSIFPSEISAELALNDTENNTDSSNGPYYELVSKVHHSPSLSSERWNKKAKFDQEIESFISSSGSKYNQYKSLLSAQNNLLTSDLMKCPKFAEIILESSLINLSRCQVVILPWNENDLDIKNEFWINNAPPNLKYISLYSTSTASSTISTRHPSEICNEKKITSIKPSMPSYDVYLNGWNLLDKKWTDPDGFISLSTNQENKFYAWKRISAMIKSSEYADTLLMHRTPESKVIRQGFIGDCSFLASLAALAEYEKKFNIPVLSKILYPQSKYNSSYPVYNSKGMYACKLYFNGVFRKVLVDDYIPINRNGKILAAHSSIPGEFWVTLMEKCFAKLLGGTYAIQGSNPGSDLYHLTGWIPDTIPFRTDILTPSPDIHKTIITGSESFEITDTQKWDAIWNCLYNSLLKGRCVACLGTSELAEVVQSTDFPENVSQKSGIVAKHAYAIVNSSQVFGLKLLFVKNPWCCTRWKNKYSPSDKVSWTAELQKALKYNQKEAAATDDGYFWIAWEDVIQWFSHLYLCWNYNNFEYQIDMHSRWVLSESVKRVILPDDSYLLAFNPQFLLEFPNAEEPIECWILLSHHVCNRSSFQTHKYLAVHIYSGRERLICPTPPLHHGIYSNGECTLVKLLIGASGSTVGFQTSSIPLQPLLLVVSQFSQKAGFNFTLKICSTRPAKISQLPDLVKPTTETLYLQGSFLADNAGGSSNEIESYLTNPHIRVYLPHDGKVLFILECSKEYSLNARVFYGQMASPRALRLNQVESSGPYRISCCSVQCNLPAGCYTLVISTFNKGELGPYQLSMFYDKLDLGPTKHKSSNSAYFQSKEIVLAHMPNPYLSLSSHLFHHLVVLSSDFKKTKNNETKLYIKLSHRKPEAQYINISVRVEVESSFAMESVLGMSLYRVLKDKSVVIICKSDLEGGYNYRESKLSSTAISVYNSKKLLTLSSASLNTNLFPYYLSCSPIDVVQHYSSSPILESNHDLELGFKMHIISDEVLFVP